MSNAIRLKLVTLNGLKYDDDVYEVLLPTMDGLIGVMPDHMPLVSVAAEGVISIRKNATDPDDFMEHYATHGGVIEVSDNVLSVLLDEADNADEINEQEAKDAYERAQKMKKEAKDQVSLEQAQSLVDRSAVRLDVVSRKRRRKH